MAAAHAESDEGMIFPQGSNMSPVSRDDFAGLTPNGVPTLSGSTANEAEDKPALISNEMLQAYVMMRGPVNEANPHANPYDPLLNWLRRRGGLQQQNVDVSDGKKKDLRRVLSDIERTLRLDGGPKDSPQTSVFGIQRPAFENIQPRPGMGLPVQNINASSADFESEQDKGGKGKHVLRGRISPSTFLDWSKGCTTWKEGRNEKRDSNLPESSSRRRPQSPECSDTPLSDPRSDRWPKFVQNQDCLESGAPLSPYYHVPSSPSMIWDAEGIDCDRMDFNPHFEDLYSRMDPKSAEKLRQLKKFRELDSDIPSPASKNELHGDSEVDEIFSDAIKKFGPSTELEVARNFIAGKHAIVKAVNAKCSQLDSTIREQTTRIRNLKLYDEVVRLAAWNLKNKRKGERIREEKKAREEEAFKAQAQERKERLQHILGHFGAHLMDIDNREKQARLNLDMNRIKQNLYNDVIRDFEKRIIETCRKVGKTDPGEIYAELLQGEVEYRCHDPRVKGHHNLSLGSSDTDVSTMSSPTETDEVQEQPAAQEQAREDFNAQTEALRAQAFPSPPPPLDLSQFPLFFDNQYDFISPYAIWGSSPAYESVGELTTGSTVPESRGGADQAENLQSESVDIYDDQGFPISSPHQSPSQVPGLVQGPHDDSPGNANGNPIMNFPRTMPQMQGQNGDVDGGFDFGGNVVPALPLHLHGGAIQDQLPAASEQDDSSDCSSAQGEILMAV